MNPNSVGTNGNYGYQNNIQNYNFYGCRVVQNGLPAQPASTTIPPQSNGSSNYGIRGPPQNHYTQEYPANFHRRSSFSMEDATDGGFFATRYNLETNEIELYCKRLSTFRGKWPPNAAVTVESVAKAGMSYIGPDDKVQCDYCRGILYSFEAGDIPLNEHQRHFPLCQYLELRSYETLETQLVQQEGEKQRIQIQPEIELSERFQAMNPSMDCQQEEHVIDVTKHPVFEIVKQCGYSDDMVKRAFNQVLTYVPIGEINTGNVLDQIFQLEEC